MLAELPEETLAGAEAHIPMAAVREAVQRVIIGKDSTICLALCALLADGHVLIEDCPGVGKTTLARAIAASLGCSFKRIQFTPDLLPADVTGTAIYNQRDHEFQFRRGPIFANVVLADEINRSTPKTQSSLLEAMEEFQVTIDGETYQLARPFFVIATQNNIEYGGTYPLPEAQLDRFMLRIEVGYPTRDEEVAVLTSQMSHHPLADVVPVVGPAQILAAQKEVRQVHVDPSLRQYIVDIVTKTRSHPAVNVGASPRGSIGLLQASRAWAVLHARNFCTPDDVKALAGPVLGHRLILHGAHSASSLAIVDEILGSIPAPVLQ